MMYKTDFQRYSDDKKRLVRELDWLLNGHDGGAKQTSLADIVAQVQREADPGIPMIDELKLLRKKVKR